jgi:hypothetical protein
LELSSGDLGYIIWTGNWVTTQHWGLQTRTKPERLSEIKDSFAKLQRYSKLDYTVKKEKLKM